MNTEQMYVGRGSHASQPTPEAKNGPQSPFQADDWRDDFLLTVGTNKGQKDSLFELLNVVRDQADSFDPVPLLLYLLDHWSSSPYVRLEAKENRTRIQQITSLVNFFIQFKERYDEFYSQTDYDEYVENEGEREVSRG